VARESKRGVVIAKLDATGASSFGFCSVGEGTSYLVKRSAANDIIRANVMQEQGLAPRASG
jgi:hypothetical protein